MIDHKYSCVELEESDLQPTNLMFCSMLSDFIPDSIASKVLLQFVEYYSEYRLDNTIIEILPLEFQNFNSILRAKNIEDLYNIVDDRCQRL